MTDKKKQLVAQVCEVNKALLSVSAVATSVNRMVSDGDGSYIENIETGQITRSV